LGCVQGLVNKIKFFGLGLEFSKNIDRSNEEQSLRNIDKASNKRLKQEHDQYPRLKLPRENNPNPIHCIDLLMVEKLKLWLWIGILLSPCIEDRNLCKWVFDIQYK